jgi:hypothetical protein
MKQNDTLLVEKNTIQEHSKTYFYVNSKTNPITYGVALNLNDIADYNEITAIIRKAKADNKEQLEAWNKEQMQRNSNEIK